MRDGDRLEVTLPGPVDTVLAGLADVGEEAALVGGCVRDLLRGEVPADWDIATSAPPEVVAGRFPGSTWQNPFGTVTVLAEGGPGIEVTTYRVEGSYRDRRRPDHVRWGRSLREDLARRDFTVNAIAWVPGEDRRAGSVVDPFGGAEDLAGRILRAVGDPDERFAEDALRLVRAVRFATRFDLHIDGPTEAAIRRHAAAVATLSGERLRGELIRILSGSVPPSHAFELMDRLGLLAVLMPELTALKGVPQAKARAGDAFEHSLRAMDALPASDPTLRLAGLLHDLGKATTLADGHFLGHETVGADQAEALLRRLRFPRAEITRVGRLVRQHMFAYGPEWTDAAVRRFIRRAGVDLLDDLFALREADDVASGFNQPANGGLPELAARAFAAVAADPLDTRQLAVDGHILADELGLAPGPRIGRLLSRLLEAVLEDPSLNDRRALLALARDWAGSELG